jgi:Kef-type K+ transport system membrane component KefB
MDHHHVVLDLAICIVAAWILGVIAQAARQPLLLAYLVAGVIIGPVGLKLVAARESVETVSGIGLLLLLFLIGLEIDLKKIMSTGRLIIVTALAQIGGSFLLGLAIFWLCGFSLSAQGLDALYLAMGAALSSTVIIVKLLYEQRQLDTLQGRITLGVLVLQDLVAILFLAVQPNLTDPSIGILFQSFFRVIILLAIAFLASR